MTTTTNDPMGLIILGVLVLGYIFLHVLAIKSAKGNIQRFLQESGATAINIQYEWPDLDRDTYSFAVNYKASNGKQKSTRCKIHHFWFFPDYEIFWTNPTEMDLSRRNPVDPKVDYIIRTKFKKKFPSYEIVKLLAVPRSDERIILLKYTEDFQNVLRCRPDGTVIWQAELPTPEDTYKEIKWEDEELIATSRYLRSYSLDKETGKIISPHP